MTQARDLAAPHREARENLAFFGQWQRPGGQSSRAWASSTATAKPLWAIAEHILRTGDSAFARGTLPGLGRSSGCARRASRTRSSSSRSPTRATTSLSPAIWRGTTTSGPWPGWRPPSTRRGYPATASAAPWSLELEALRAVERRRVGEAAARNGARSRRCSTAPGGATGAISGRPGRNRSSTRRRRSRRRRWLMRGATSARCLATYGEFHNLHHHLAFRVWQTELLRDEPARVAPDLYDPLAHTTNTHGGFETGVRPHARRSVDDNLAPHGWFAAELVALIRNMLVRARDGGLELLSGLPGRWPAPGRANGRSQPAAEARPHRPVAAPAARRRGAALERRGGAGHGAVVAGAGERARRARRGPAGGHRAP